MPFKKPTEVQEGDCCDKRGIPIHAGDLLKTFHFREARYRRVHYLYHVVVWHHDGNSKSLRMIPVSAMAEQIDFMNAGGSCVLTALCDDQGWINNSEIIDGKWDYPKNAMPISWHDRPKKLKKPD